MGRTSTARLGAVLPNTTGSPTRDRSDGRLDPVRWHRPARGTLLRLIVATLLLSSAILISWPGLRSCGTGAEARDGVGVQDGKAVQAGAGSEIPSVETSAASNAPGRDAVQPVPAGSVGVPVRLADPAALALVEAGNRVDLLRLDESGSTTPVADSALVLQVSGSDDPTIGGLLLALTPDEAEHAVAGPGQSFAVLIRPG